MTRFATLFLTLALTGCFAPTPNWVRPAGVVVFDDDDATSDDDDATLDDDDATPVGDDDDSASDDDDSTAIPAIDADGDGRTTAIDCDDTDPTVYPGAEEMCNDLDDNCDGQIDEVCGDDDDSAFDDDDDSTAIPAIDADGDGYTQNIDCNDADATIHPGAPELCNGLDDNCDSSAPAELDADADGFLACEDCNDQNSGVHPGASEWCDGLDSNCDGVIPEWELDLDGDGYAGFCGNVDGWVDCDDSDASVHPGALEIVDGIDNDCDGQIDEMPLPVIDLDGDGFSAIIDCDDLDASIHPGAPDICGDGIDSDCDADPSDEMPFSGVIDLDGDGFGSIPYAGCAVPANATSIGGDCDDLDASTYPGAPELCDAIDQDCDGNVDDGFIVLWDDDDGDGFGDDLGSFLACMADGFVLQGGDCDDMEALTNPAEDELDFGVDGIDNDCDGQVDNDFSVQINVTYPNSGYYTLNEEFYQDLSDFGNSWDWTSGAFNTPMVSDTILPEYNLNVETACGLRFNVNVGIPETDWLCYAGVIDPAVVIDIWWLGSWYNESDLTVWIADPATGSCSAVLQVDPSSACTPVNN